MSVRLEFVLPNKSLQDKRTAFYGQEIPSGESTTTVRGVNYKIINYLQ